MKKATKKTKVKKKTKAKAKKAGVRTSKLSLFKTKLAQFKKIVEAELGDINWREVSKAVLLLLVAAGFFGVFGLKAKMVAKFIWPFVAGAQV